MHRPCDATAFWVLLGGDVAHVTSSFSFFAHLNSKTSHDDDLLTNAQRQRMLNTPRPIWRRMSAFLYKEVKMNRNVARADHRYGQCFARCVCLLSRLSMVLTVRANTLRDGHMRMTARDRASQCISMSLQLSCQSTVSKLTVIIDYSCTYVGNDINRPVTSHLMTGVV